MSRAKEILFLKERVHQLEMQLSIVQKQFNKKGRNPRYTVREKLLVLWQTSPGKQHEEAGANTRSSQQVNVACEVANSVSSLAVHDRNRVSWQLAMSKAREPRLCGRRMRLDTAPWCVSSQ